MEIKLHIAACMLMLIFFTGSSCSIKGGPAGKREVVEIRINHFKQTAMGIIPQLVMLVQEEDDIGGENWSYFYDPIERFDFEPGYIYDLKAMKIEVENPPQDGSSIKYVMINLRSKTKAPEGEQFDIGLKRYGENYIHGANPNFTLLEDYEINCASLCDELEDKQKDPSATEVMGTFIHGPEQTLILQSLN